MLLSLDDDLHVKKSNISIDSFLRYWLSKNPAVWLVESVLGHNWRTRIYPDLWLPQNHKEHCFLCTNVMHQWIKFLVKSKKKKKPILEEFLEFFPKMRIFLKYLAFSFFDSWDPLTSGKISEKLCKLFQKHWDSCLINNFSGRQTLHLFYA